MTNRDGYEGYNYSPKNETTQEQETADLELIFPYAMESFFKRLYPLYPAGDFNSTLFQRQTIYGDYIVECVAVPVLRLNQAEADVSQLSDLLLRHCSIGLGPADVQDDLSSRHGAAQRRWSVPLGSV